MPPLVFAAMFAAAQLWPATAAAAGISDPLAAVRALYRPAGRMPGLTEVYQLASLPLRQRLMANGICTIPKGTRAIACLDTIDALQNKTGQPAQAIAAEPIPTNAAARTITVILPNAPNYRQLRFNFSRAGTGWSLDDITSGASAEWALSRMTSDGRMGGATAPPLPLVPSDGATTTTPALGQPLQRQIGRKRRIARQD